MTPQSCCRPLGPLGDESTGQNIWPACQAGSLGLSRAAFPPWTGGGDRPGWGGVREQQDAALPDLVVAQTQHLQCPEAQETPWDGLQLVVV